MEKTEIKEKDLRKIIRETIENTEVKTYYVANSSYFDTHPYDTKKISLTVKKAGGINIRTENAYDWENQPEVVVFESAPEMVENITSLAAFFLGTEWVHIKEKDW